jgi:hypothetical protein
MKKNGIFLLLFCLSLLQGYTQNQTLKTKERIAEFKTLFIQNIQIQSGSLSKYKNINFKMDSCSITLETVDFENQWDENSVIIMPTSGAVVHENGEISYETKAIKEILENKISKQITTHFYNSSAEIGLFLKFENQEKYKEIQERIKELSGACTAKN